MHPIKYDIRSRVFCVSVPYRVEEVPSLFQVEVFFYHELMFGFYQMLFLYLCVTLVIWVFCPCTHLFFFFFFFWLV